MGVILFAKKHLAMKHFHLYFILSFTLVACYSEDESSPLPISDATVVIHPDYGQGTRSADCPFEVVYEPELRQLSVHFFTETPGAEIRICHDSNPAETYLDFDSQVFTIPISGEPGIWKVWVEVEDLVFIKHFYI